MRTRADLDEDVTMFLDCCEAFFSSKNTKGAIIIGWKGRNRTYRSVAKELAQRMVKEIRDGRED